MAAPAAPAASRTGSASPPGSRRGIAIGAVVALLAVAVAAFALTRGDDDSKVTTAASASPSSSSGSTTTTIAVRTAEQVAADEATATAIKLQAAEAGPEYTAAPSEFGDDSPLTLSTDRNMAPCMELPARSDVDKPTLFVNDTMTDPSGREIYSSVTVYANERAAKDDFKLLTHRKLQSCLGSYLDNSLGEILAARPVPAIVKFGNAVIADHHLGNVHADDVVAIRALLPIQVLQVSARIQDDLVYARIGRTIVNISFITDVEAFPIDYELSLMNLVVDRTPKS